MPTNSAQQTTNCVAAVLPLPGHSVLQLIPGQRADAGMRLVNCGTQEVKGARIERISGDLGPALSDAPNIRPSESANAWIALDAPSLPGCYRGIFQLRDEKGLFGEPFSIMANVRPQGAASESMYLAGHLSLPPGSVAPAGQDVDKGLRLINCGELPWDNHEFVRVSGEVGPATFRVPATAIGQDVDLWLPINLPKTPGMYRVGYQMKGPQGVFGPVVYINIQAK